jgi:hypothetical protein
LEEFVIETDMYTWYRAEVIFGVPCTLKTMRNYLKKTKVLKTFPRNNFSQNFGQQRFYW